VFPLSSRLGPPDLWRWPLLSSVLNILIFLRIAGLRLAHEAGWDGFGPLIIGLAIVGVLIGLLSPIRQLLRTRQTAAVQA
jgi:hypothetical protein